MSQLEEKTMHGLVQTVAFNESYALAKCQTPVTTDPMNRAEDCLQMQLAADSYHNYVTYLSMWKAFTDAGGCSIDMKRRPCGSAQLNQQMSMHSSWLNIVDVRNASLKWNRVVNNVSLALPNIAVANASQDRINHITQPRQFDDFGHYILHAAVPSPVVTVLCVNISKAELSPMIYEEWPNAQKPLDYSTQWPPLDSMPVSGPEEWLNTTAVDDTFGFGRANGKERRMPVFPKYPAPYNTIANATGEHINAVYLLTAAPLAYPETYSLCQLSAWRTPSCSP